ncbi:MAG: M50 family metallopeptidase [Coriobacteriia bacterium]
MAGVLSVLNIVFWGVLTFSILVVLHEGGHFLAARTFGVKVHEFMIGLPGPAIRLETKKTTFGITAIPLGGYVRIAGMEPGAEDERLGDALDAIADAERLDIAGLSRVLMVDRDHATSLMTTLEDYGAVVSDELHDYALVAELDSSLRGPDLIGQARGWTYRGLPTWKRIAVLVSGVTVNLVTAILVFTIVLAIFGNYEAGLTLDYVQPDAPAAAAGLEVGDTLSQLDGESLDSWVEFQQLMNATRMGDTVTLTYVRDGAKATTDVVLADLEGHGFLGVRPSFVKVDYSVVQALGMSFEWTGMVFVAIIEFFRPDRFANSVENSRGVVGISVMAADAAKSGPLDYAWLIALLSLSLGAMNLLPIPPLDGGKVAIEVIERVAGRPLGRKVSLALSAAGAVLLFSLIGYLMYADVVRLAQ